MSNGALFGVPIPEAYEAMGEELQSAVETAIVESIENGVSKRGKEVTPWLLKRVGELTQGKSLTSSAFSAQFYKQASVLTEPIQMLPLLKTQRSWVVG